MFQRPQQIMRQFARNGWRVIYCNVKQDMNKPLFEEVEPNLFVCNNFNALMQTHTPVDVFYSTWAKCHTYIGAFKPKVVIYDRVDEFSEWEQYEPDMLRQSHIVFTTSEVLFEKTLKLHNRVYKINNACDPKHFNPSKAPKVVFGNITPPIVCFIGALGTWVDTDILKQITGKYKLLIVGPKFGNNPPPGAFYMDMVDYNDLPKFYNSIDIGIIPFLDCQVSRAANPIKMYEYLAMGKPVVATDLPDTKIYPDFVNVVKKGESFVDVIGKVLENDSVVQAQARREFALKNSWEKRYEQMANAINSYCNEVGIVL